MRLQLCPQDTALGMLLNPDFIWYRDFGFQKEGNKKALVSLSVAPVKQQS